MPWYMASMSSALEQIMIMQDSQEEAAEKPVHAVNEARSDIALDGGS